MKLMPGVYTEANFSKDEQYRYSLLRLWDPDAPSLLWLMLNPSTASAEIDDPTVRRTQTFARAWGYGSVTIGNIFALRSTSPKLLYTHPDPVGPYNNRWISKLAGDADDVIVAWGTHGKLNKRGLEVAEQLCDHELWCLGTSRRGEPLHPLYIKGDQDMVRWTP